MCEVCNALKNKAVIDKDLYYTFLREQTTHDYYYTTKSVDEPDFEVDTEMGEGEATEEEIDYRSDLMTILAGIFPGILAIVKGKGTVTEKTEKIDEILDGFYNDARKVIISKTNEAFDSAVSDANVVLEGLKDGIKTVKGDLDNLIAIQQQQTDNIQDISNYLRGRLIQGMNLNEVNSLYDTELDYDYINSAFNEAQLRLDQLGVFGWVESHKQGTTTALIEGMAIIGAVLVADWVPDYSNPNPEWPCEECIDLEENGPYPVIDWPAPPHFGCRCEQENVRIEGT